MSIVAVIDQKPDGVQVRVPIERAELPNKIISGNDRVIMFLGFIVAILIALQVVGAIYMWRLQTQTTDVSQQLSNGTTSIREDVQQLQNVTGEIVSAIEVQYAVSCSVLSANVGKNLSPQECAQLQQGMIAYARNLPPSSQ